MDLRGSNWRTVADSGRRYAKVGVHPTRRQTSATDSRSQHTANASGASATSTYASTAASGSCFATWKAALCPVDDDLDIRGSHQARRLGHLPSTAWEPLQVAEDE